LASKGRHPGGDQHDQPPRWLSGAAAKLVEAGLDPATPVLTTWGGHHHRAAHRGRPRWADIGKALPHEPLEPAGLTVIGDVGGAARVAVLVRDPSRCSVGGSWCRARRSSRRGLVSRLRSFGAVPEEVPTISVEPPRAPQQMERAIKGLVTGRYEWIAFTSRNAVKAVRGRSSRSTAWTRRAFLRHQGGRGR